MSVITLCYRGVGTAKAIGKNKSNNPLKKKMNSKVTRIVVHSHSETIIQFEIVIKSSIHFFS